MTAGWITDQQTRLVKQLIITTLENNGQEYSFQFQTITLTLIHSHEHRTVSNKKKREKKKNTYQKTK